MVVHTQVSDDSIVPINSTNIKLSLDTDLRMLMCHIGHDVFYSVEGYNCVSTSVERIPHESKDVVSRV